MPLWATLLTSLTLGVFFQHYAVKLPFDNLVSPGKNALIWPAVLLVIGLLAIVYKSYLLEKKDGHWDAWWFWNLRANFLTRSDNWKLAFSGKQYGTMFT